VQEAAHEQSQKYKEGKYILERYFLILLLPNKIMLKKAFLNVTLKKYKTKRGKWKMNQMVVILIGAFNGFFHTLWYSTWKGKFPVLIDSGP
jgi:hypothetical protein